MVDWHVSSVEVCNTLVATIATLLMAANCALAGKMVQSAATTYDGPDLMMMDKWVEVLARLI